MRETTVDEQLAAHLRLSLGVWPPPAGGLTITTSAARTEPGWDGVVRPFAGLRTPDGAVLSVEPALLERARELIFPLPRPLGPGPTFEAAKPGIEALLGARLFDVMHRYSVEPAALEPLGEWLAFDDPVVPAWLRPFGGDVLVLVEGGRYVAGVGLKKHDENASEISVGTEEAARGRGLARRLVVTAARRVLDEDKVPTYLHDLRNVASAAVAEVSGFPDRGWRALVAM